MKRITAALLLILSIGVLEGADLESYEFIDTLFSLSGPGAPMIFEDSVIFTAASSYRRVGISFAHEDYSRVHWYQKLMLPEDPAKRTEAEKKKNITIYRDSGILFHVETIPEGMKNMEYRMIIDGLWTSDPLNLPNQDAAGNAGLNYSRVNIPSRHTLRFVDEQDASLGPLFLTYRAPPGEIVTVGGSFNGWDPFMYELKETSPGLYSLNLSLSPGIYQYVFFHRGERILDPNNLRETYTKEGKAASEVVIR